MPLLVLPSYRYSRCGQRILTCLHPAYASSRSGRSSSIFSSDLRRKVLLGYFSTMRPEQCLDMTRDSVGDVHIGTVEVVELGLGLGLVH